MDSNKLKVTVLGCGDSAGVPRIGGDWGNCDPTNPLNRRTRPSIMVRSEKTTIVVDTGPDFNLQLTRENISLIDAVLYTHAHSDHVTGMDDLRILKQRKEGRPKIPIYADKGTMDELTVRFPYIFEEMSQFYPAVVEPHIFSDTDFGRVNRVGDIEFIPFVQDHGMGNVSLGFRFGNVGYSTDMVNLDDNALRTLKGIKTWIADCADFSQGHGTLHSTLPMVQKLNETIGAQQVYLTHLKMFDDYQVMRDALPKGYTPLHDGLVIECA